MTILIIAAIFDAITTTWALVHRIKTARYEAAAHQLNDRLAGR